MLNHPLLSQALLNLDGAPYPAYRDLQSVYQFSQFQLHLRRIQRDPFASPSQIALIIDNAHSQFPARLIHSGDRRLGLRDFIARRIVQEAQRLSCSTGSGNSGKIQTTTLGQEILDRTLVLFDGDRWEVRLGVGLPGRGRRIDGTAAEKLLCNALPQLVNRCLLASAYELTELTAHCEALEDQIALRQQLAERGLVAFIANGAVLPRCSGIDPRPLASNSAVTFQAPTALAVTLPCPHQGEMTGMGIPQGVTLIVGGGYHGKSTLLSAIALGVYNQPLGDGREKVVSVANATKVRAEEGRSVTGVNLSPFINQLPRGQSTQEFSTQNASGSTSQAVNIVEALEAGSTLLLLDEDTCATNFMIRDRRMQQLIHKSQEPITPFIDKVRQLYEDKGISSILVMGGSGDYFEVADTVIALESYHVQDVTPQAKAIAAQYPSQRQWEGGKDFGTLPQRQVDLVSFDPRRGKRAVSVKARSVAQLSLGQSDIDLSAVEQLVEANQVRAIGAALAALFSHFGSQTLPMEEILSFIHHQLLSQGVQALSQTEGNLAAFPPLELAAAINRLRTLTVQETH